MAAKRQAAAWPLSSGVAIEEGVMKKLASISGKA